jgi:chloramphenicol O-acetyltransferase type A
MKRYINLTTWKRRQHFELFLGYENPFWSVNVSIDCTKMHERAKREHFPFYLGYHFASIRAINEIDAFRQRIENGSPVEYDTVHLSTTIVRPDGTFGFSFIPYTNDFVTFLADGIVESERVRESSELFSGNYGNDIIYCTVFRGVPFAAVSQPYRAGSSIPLLAFGETFLENGVRKIPHSVHVHHSLVDGQHVGEYFRLFQKYLNE